MAPICTVRSVDRNRVWKPSVYKPWLLCCLAAILALPGCHGCSSDQQNPPDAEKKSLTDALHEKDKPKPDFDPVRLTIVPQKTGENELVRRLVKPGHWTAAVEQTKANNFDFNGTLYAETRDEAGGPPSELEHVPNRLAISRPAALPKGQAKLLELLFFVPGDNTKAWLATELRNRGGAIAASPGPEPLTLMKAYQYNLVVLAEQPFRYRQLERMDSVRAPHSASTDEVDTGLRYYQVITPPLEKPLPLPSHALAWTSIAYLIWDDVDPSLLSPEQQQALVDWLHWGGQLIISGSKSLDLLRDKAFLGSYLPALPGEPLSLSAETLKPLNDEWTRPVNKEPGQPLTPVTPWSGVTLLPQGDAQVLVPQPAADGQPPPNTPEQPDLVVQRRVGRGRIVVTAFRLTQRELWTWPSFDGFVNGCLLRRPPREFSKAADLGGLSVDWAAQPLRYRDPLLVTGLRFFSRDWNGETGYADPPTAKPKPESDNISQDASQQPTRPRFHIGFMAPHLPVSDELEASNGPGIAGWNDFSAPANAARDALRQAAGLVIPKADFVIRVLGLYLLVLVPLNWLVFRSLGRVEWAWIAAPVIAVGGMALVVKAAQLNIGFARSQTELAVLELHAGYPRGHLTRYTALYTSLSTTYDAHSDNSSTLVLPFASDPDFEPRPGQPIDTVSFQSEPAAQLNDYGVSSNTTALLHTEQMIDAGGAIVYDAGSGEVGNSGAITGDHANADLAGASLTNQSNLNMKRAAVVRRMPSDRFEMAWIGDLPPGRKAKLGFEAIGSETPLPADWSYNLSTGEAGNPKLSLQPLADLVRGPHTLQPGETRLVALIDGPLPGLEIEPAASQATRGGTLVVVNLQYATPAKPQPDVNTHGDIISPQDERRNETEPPPDEKTPDDT